MKKIVSLFTLISFSSYSQESKTMFSIKIKNPIEIDGHIIKNKVFRINSDGYDFNIKEDGDTMLYVRRKCEVKDCDIFHLVEKYSGTLINSEGIRFTPNNMLLTK